MVEVRERIMSGPTVSGTASIRGNSYIRTYPSSTGWMEDVVGNRHADNPVRQELYTRKGGLLEGQRNGIYDVIFSHYPHNFMAGAVAHLPVEGDPSDFDAAVVGTARGNPTRPDVSLPVSIAELRDLPRMTYARGKSRGGNSVAESEFGWAPLVSDVKKLFSFPELHQQRVSMLQAMKSKGGLSRTSSAFSGESKVETPGVRVHSAHNTSIYGIETIITTVSKKVTAKWSPLPEIQGMGNEQMAKKARNLTLGLDPRQFTSQAWDLLPWSWCADWFSNFGDWMSIYSSGIDVAPSKCCVSTVRRTSKSWSITDTPDFVSCSGGSVTRKSWTRVVNVPLLPSFRLPALSNRQSLILTSIAANARSSGRGS